MSSADEGATPPAPAIEDDSNGLAAAEIAVPVPNLRASLRVIFPLILFLSRAKTISRSNACRSIWTAPDHCVTF
jgi:hypothetical protein